VGAYTEPSADGLVLDVASQDEDAIVAHVCAHAMEWIGADEAKRMRFERERGASPASISTAGTRAVVGSMIWLDL
jgi:hypothetical protein